MLIQQERLAKIIKTRRLDMGLSQEQLAEKIDNSIRFIGQMARVEWYPHYENLQAIRACLGFDANEMLAENPIGRDDLSELFNLTLHMDEKKRSLLIEFARLLHKTPL